MKHPRTLYAILGVTSDADPDVVRAAYRALAKKYHPDVAGKFQMSDLAFRTVAEAYAVLSDVEKRRIYDASLEKLGANTARTFTDEAANTAPDHQHHCPISCDTARPPCWYLAWEAVLLLLLTLMAALYSWAH
jgi:DnaJ-class molecular chaperone